MAHNSTLMRNKYIATVRKSRAPFNLAWQSVIKCLNDAGIDIGPISSNKGTDKATGLTTASLFLKQNDLYAVLVWWAEELVRLRGFQSSSETQSALLEARERATQLKIREAADIPELPSPLMAATPSNAMAAVRQNQIEWRAWQSVVKCLTDAGIDINKQKKLHAALVWWSEELVRIRGFQSPSETKLALSEARDNATRDRA